MSAPEATRAEDASLFDKAAYLFALLGVYVMLFGLFFYGFWGKAVDGDFKIPDALDKQFDKTFIGTFPTGEVAWVLIALLEGLIALLIVASVATLEWSPSRRKPLLLTALALALLNFGVLSFGQDAVGNTDGVASLYAYFGATVIILIFVRSLPPYRSRHWLG